MELWSAAPFQIQMPSDCEAVEGGGQLAPADDVRKRFSDQMDIAEAFHAVPGDLHGHSFDFFCWTHSRLARLVDRFFIREM